MTAILRPLLLAVALWPALTSAAAPERVVGWIETVTLSPWDVAVKAKLDSGALTSSLDARHIETFEKAGEDWVRFRLMLEDEASGKTFSMTLERPLFRDMVVRGAGGRDDRLVVLMDICVGETRYEEEFSLRNREEMTYPMLLGRRTIGHLGRLDVRETFLTEADCDEDSPRVPHAPERGEAGDED
ncbi:ATP-dependent zinc protease family protein [Halomonas maura]|uniref:retropepsin-like aspartic peptidase RloA3 n=1 Tax=Halomonas maura TaxID=117606 RepID=UPI0025B5BAF0|nr:RimK/LysX family protein [Halomonas maura]MDN3557293.1 RimK/LysX family protein [Halomonas maura]